MDHELQKRHLHLALALDIAQLRKKLYLKSLCFTLIRPIVQVIPNLENHREYLLESFIVPDPGDCRFQHLQVLVQLCVLEVELVLEEHALESLVQRADL